MMHCSLLVASLLLGSLWEGKGQTSCQDICEPDTDAGEEDCCAYIDDAETIDYCQSDELAIGTYWFDDCDTTDSDDNSTTNSTNYWDCSLNWDVDFVGNSGQFKLYPCDDSNFFIKVNFHSIQAYDSDGSKQSTNKVTSFAYSSAVYGDHDSGNSSVYSWKDADGNDKTLGGVTLDYIFEVGKSNTEVTFLMNLYLIDDITEVTWTDSNGTDHTQYLSQASIKFDYTIENWPFENDDDYLEITVRLNTGGTTNDGSSDGSSDGASSFSWGDEFVVMMPETYEKTDSSDSVTSEDTDIECENTGSGKHTYCTFRFNNAGNAAKIAYDPWIASTFTENSDSSMSLINASQLGLMVAMAVSLIVALV